MKILVVEDYADTADLLGELFCDEGHTVRIARDGLQALLTAAIFWPDAAVVDIKLPRVDGFEVASGLRKLNPAMKLIALTGWPSKQVSPAKLARFDIYVQKPVSPDAILALLSGPRPRPIVVRPDQPGGPLELPPDVELDPARSPGLT
jgi:CheY-like chemotaxis protein